MTCCGVGYGITSFPIVYGVSLSGCTGFDKNYFDQFLSVRIGGALCLAFDPVHSCT